MQLSFQRNTSPFTIRIKFLTFFSEIIRRDQKTGTTGHIISTFMGAILRKPHGEAHVVPTTSFMASRFCWIRKICRIFGCFFIVGLGEHPWDAMTVPWTSWYSAYAAFCFLTCIFTDVFYDFRLLLLTFAKYDAFTRGLMVLMHTTLLLNAILNFASIVYGSSRMLKFFRDSEHFEKAIKFYPHWTFKMKANPLKAFRYGALLTAAATVVILAWTLLSFPVWQGASIVVEVFMKLIYLFGMTVYVVYDSLHFLTLTCCCEVLVQYIRAQREDFVETVALFKHGCREKTAEAIEEIRIKLSAIRNLKETLNDVWKWSIISVAMILLLVVCIGTTTQLAGVLTTDMTSLFLVECVLKALQFVDIIILSQAMVNEVSRYFFRKHFEIKEDRLSERAEPAPKERLGCLNRSGFIS